MTTTTITDVGTVAVPVADQDRALDFYVDTLGFEKRLDVPMPGGGRWLTVAPPGAAVAVSLTAGEGTAVGVDTGIRFVATDAVAEHAAMAERRVDVDAVVDWPGVPPMFSFRDVDGNRLYVVEAVPAGAAS
jgi:catechol 2,3-dioxygenase-like lactoylglutathione lyase family enzyme